MARLKTNHAGTAPVMTTAIDVVDSLLHDAIIHKASDIHLESTENGLRVRYRIDGMLHDQYIIEAAMMPQIIARLKVLAHINVIEKRLPLDGKFTIVKDGNTIDVRVSTFPGLYGEKMVLRILDRAHNNIALESLGMHEQMLAVLKDLISKASGFFLVAGPTGSGKTTTLYAALAALNGAHKNIITLEDPVEYSVAGITQGHINPDVGFTFAKGIRAVLRQDPDILMVGEIRDKETARVAIEAALTGHVVLSTVHTNDAPSVIIRLMDMGIEPYLINAAVSGVLAQRLARKICDSCKVQTAPSDYEAVLLERAGIKLAQAFYGTGCTECMNLGYKGRTGIFELLPMQSSLRSLIVHNPSFDAIYDQVRRDGVGTLLHDGAQKVAQGIITVSELFRTVG